MDNEQQMKEVESVLAQFPKEVSANYEDNKKTLEIEYHQNFSMAGQYNIFTNKIVLRTPNALKHELFHVACSNRQKFGREFMEGFRSDSGVSYFRSTCQGPIYGDGFSEGFVQSLANMANMPVRGVIFETYIVELLISIYGSYLYQFPLQNDQIGFYNYCSQNIHQLKDHLDLYRFQMGVVKESKENRSKLLQKLEAIYLYMKRSIEDIITEYNICKYEPQVSRMMFKEQIEELFDDFIFWESYQLLPIKEKFINEVEKILKKEFVSKRYVFQENVQKIKKFLHFSEY